MFTNLLEDFQAYFSTDSQAQKKGLINLENKEKSLIKAAKKLPFENLQIIIEHYLQTFDIKDITSIIFHKEDGLFCLELLIINNFDDLKTMPFDLLFPLIEKVTIISQNNINKPISNPNDKSHFLEQCPNLQILMLEDNKASCFYNLEQINSLEIHSEYPISIKKEIIQLKTLQTLKIVASYYTKLCPEIAQLGQLKNISCFVFNSVIGSNILDLFRDTLQNNLIYLSHCSNLENLTLTLDEYIKTLPELANLKQIKRLSLYNISHTFFYNLPALLADNSALQHLYTYIDIIPRHFTKLEETVKILTDKYDFYFESDRNPYDGKKYFSLIDIYY